jgi:hypothetical protein
MIKREHPFDIRPDLRKAALTKAESTKAAYVIRPNQLVRNNNHPVKKEHFYMLCTKGK